MTGPHSIAYPSDKGAGIWYSAAVSCIASCDALSNLLISTFWIFSIWSAVIPSLSKMRSVRLWLASSLVNVTPIVSVAPLCTIPLSNSPLAFGVVISASTFAPPPDCPNTVTFEGSPPNCSIFSWIHFNAFTISSSPALAEY